MASTARESSQSLSFGIYKPKSALLFFGHELLPFFFFLCLFVGWIFVVVARRLNTTLQNFYMIIESDGGDGKWETTAAPFSFWTPSIIIELWSLRLNQKGVR